MVKTSSAAPVPGLRERKKARTKAAIQREALRLFSRDGYAETSVEQIAAAAEVSASTFFRYFPSKEDVVLADFLDERVLVGIVDAPADLDPFGALRHAMGRMAQEMSGEEMDLEKLRNDLIRTVPELRRGMISEMVRPMRMLAEALGRRLGRPADDPDLVMFAGAIVGGLIVTTDAEDVRDTPGDRLFGQVLHRTERLERMLRLPEPTRDTR